MRLRFYQVWRHWKFHGHIGVYQKGNCHYCKSPYSSTGKSDYLFWWSYPSISCDWENWWTLSSVLDGQMFVDSRPLAHMCFDFSFQVQSFNLHPSGKGFHSIVECCLGLFAHSAGSALVRSGTDFVLGVLGHSLFQNFIPKVCAGHFVSSTPASLCLQSIVMLKQVRATLPQWRVFSVNRILERIEE